MVEVECSQRSLAYREPGGHQVRVPLTWDHFSKPASGIRYAFEWKYLVGTVLENSQRA